ncbi:MAG TPA: L,D-transpeptidase family protein [Candidatus Acidoferrales bacterium]|nr:L,D-transpeptidase family protein [Candidatus Acidoferrales bacterium]
MTLLAVILSFLTIVPSQHRQLIVVTTKNWSAVQGVAQRFEFRGHGYVKVGPSFPVVVGKAGLAWGRGLVTIQPAAGDPIKHEGDAKSPAGIFTLPYAFGFKQTRTHLPFRILTPQIVCPDDSRSKRYNTLVDSSTVAKDWNSAEQMRSIVGYQDGVFVAFNSDPVEPGIGSCIFLHIWSDQSHGPAGTVGCTAMTKSNVLLLLRWLDPAKHPLLVQMPEPQYTHYRKSLGLPSL